jgi:hypothetical protein
LEQVVQFNFWQTLEASSWGLGGIIWTVEVATALVYPSAFDPVMFGFGLTLLILPWAFKGIKYAYECAKYWYGRIKLWKNRNPKLEQVQDLD